MNPRLWQPLMVAVLCFRLHGFTSPIAAQTVFLQGADAGTMGQILPPRTQGCDGGDSCPNCACWATSMGMVLAYWDDTRDGLDGPWELAAPGGDGSQAGPYRDCTQSLYDIFVDQYGGSPCAGTGGLGPIGGCSQDRSIARAYVNDQLGYDFTVEADDWVWWGADIQAEIDADRPVYYAYSSGGVGHATVVVGYEPFEQTMWIYDTWDHALHLRGFNEADEQCTLNITPGGTECLPGMPCCTERGFFAGKDQICMEDALYEFGCPDGPGCGRDVGIRYRDLYCDRERAWCEDNFGEWKSWHLQEQCTDLERCVPGSSICILDSACMCMCSEGACCDGCYVLPASQRCSEEPYATEHRCSSDRCGASHEIRHAYQYCDGENPSCGVSNIRWEDWEVYERCDPNEVCAVTGGGVVCQPCSSGCVDGVCTGCVPDCEGKECGRDGCGGACGMCAPDEMCGADGRCRSEPANAEDSDATSSPLPSSGCAGCSAGASSVPSSVPSAFVWILIGLLVRRTRRLR